MVDPKGSDWTTLPGRYRAKDYIKRITVYGAGNAGISEAARIKLQFPEIRLVLYNRLGGERSREKFSLLQRRQTIHLSGIYGILGWFPTL